VCEGDALFAVSNPLQGFKVKSDLEPGSQANSASFQFLKSTNLLKLKEKVSGNPGMLVKPCLPD